MGCLYTKVKRIKPEPELEPELEPIIELPAYTPPVAFNPAIPEPTIIIIEKKHRPINPVEQYKISAGLLPRITI